MSDDAPPPEVILNNHPYFLMPVTEVGGKLYLWFSICSAHRSHNPDCPTCQAGSWVEHEQVDDQRWDTFELYKLGREQYGVKDDG